MFAPARPSSAGRSRPSSRDGGRGGGGFGGGGEMMLSGTQYGQPAEYGARRSSMERPRSAPRGVGWARAGEDTATVEYALPPHQQQQQQGMSRASSVAAGSPRYGGGGGGGGGGHHQPVIGSAKFQQPYQPITPNVRNLRPSSAGSARGGGGAGGGGGGGGADWYGQQQGLGGGEREEYRGRESYTAGSPRMRQARPYTAGANGRSNNNNYDDDNNYSNNNHNNLSSNHLGGPRGALVGSSAGGGLLRPSSARTRGENNNNNNNNPLRATTAFESATALRPRTSRSQGRDIFSNDDRPWTAYVGISGERPQRKQPVPPKAGAFQVRKDLLRPSLLRRFYDRGDLPISVEHRPNENAISWKIEIEKLDYHYYLPIFFDGLREVAEPYAMFSRRGILDMLERGPARVVAVLPQLIVPIKDALNTRLPEVVERTLKILQAMVQCDERIGECLVPYYRQLLPIFNLLKAKNKNIGDHIDYSQRGRTNIGELINETLEMFEMYGGHDAFINIKYMVPTYESVMLAS